MRTPISTVNGTLFWCASPSSATSLDLFLPTLANRVDYILGLHKYNGRSALPQGEVHSHPSARAALHHCPRHGMDTTPRSPG